ncbi:uncharacterized protein LOC127800565 [Diospyros lotus]|uniref:uncharacterized protein LOC127800565 n=1 Tax=Diospyros lotus TaxID=55363 RepID=UPI0022522B03|nr:uncharacterized protein LOC127800565 [Diospyros lotus]
MIVKSSQDWDDSGSDLQNYGEIFLRMSTSDREERERVGEKKSSVLDVEAETDQESFASSEEMDESPRSVAKFRRWTPKKTAYVHSQVLRIREEDLHLGEDIEARVSAKNKLSSVHGGHHHHPHLVALHVNATLFSRPILPASPLRGKSIH